MNTRPLCLRNNGEFDLKSPGIARASSAAHSQHNPLGEAQPNYQFESSMASRITQATDRNAPDLTSPGALDNGDLGEIELGELDASLQAEPDSLPTNYVGLNEETEDEDEEEAEVDGQKSEAEETSSASEESANDKGASAGRELKERDEDHAEFERVFLQWKETGDPRLRERLILMNRSMVMFLARRFMDRGELFEDVMQVGMLGLIYALDGYDLERGVKFSTFAIPTISGEIRRYFRDKVSGMRVPRGLQELHATLKIRIEELTQQLDRSPTYAEIAFSLKIEVEQVVEAMELGAAIDPLSIDDRVYGEESATIAESVGAPDPQLQAYEEHAALQSALEKLPAQEREVLEMSYFDGHSQAEIARRMNVSQMHISRLLRRSLGQLKQLLEEE